MIDGSSFLKILILQVYENSVINIFSSSSYLERES